MIKPTLLIVDDEKPTREGLRAALEERFDVYLAEDAKAAMELLERETFDVMLTDFQMPNEDGMKLIGRAKSHRSQPSDRPRRQRIAVAVHAFFLRLFVFQKFLSDHRHGTLVGLPSFNRFVPLSKNSYP